MSEYREPEYRFNIADKISISIWEAPKTMAIICFEGWAYSSHVEFSTKEEAAFWAIKNMDAIRTGHNGRVFEENKKIADKNASLINTIAAIDVAASSEAEGFLKLDWIKDALSGDHPFDMSMDRYFGEALGRWKAK